MTRPHIHQGDPMKDLAEATFFTPEEVASFLRVSRSTIYRMIDDGRLKAMKTGTNNKCHLRIARADLLTFSVTRWED